MNELPKKKQSRLTSQQLFKCCEYIKQELTRYKEERTKLATVAEELNRVFNFNPKIDRKHVARMTQVLEVNWKPKYEKKGNNGITSLHEKTDTLFELIKHLYYELKAVHPALEEYRTKYKQS